MSIQRMFHAKRTVFAISIEVVWLLQLLYTHILPLAQCRPTVLSTPINKMSDQWKVLIIYGGI